MTNKVAFQGERGAFSETAAKKYFGAGVSVSPSFSFEDVFVKVKNKSVDSGIIPIENTLYGSIYETYDLLLKYSLTITGELSLQINHHLLSNKPYKLSELKKVYSQPQALGQCSKFLKKLTNAEIIPAYDTAGAILISNQNINEPSAAIAGKEAADIYKMKILKSNIQDNKDNFTRFIVISRSPASKKLIQPKTSICFELRSLPGALFRALSVFALRDIDLVKIESRPIPHKPFQYIFYADLMGGLKQPKIKLAINHLDEISINIRNFGSYEVGKIYKS